MESRRTSKPTELRRYCFEHAGTGCSIGRSRFVPTPVVTEWGHSRAFEDTYAWVNPLRRRVPITRVLNVTPLDFVGLPVWSAVTPLARDLTVHAGKGATPRAAQLSAMMEAIERVCGESMPDDCIRRASHDPLAREEGPAVLDPETLNLPFDTLHAPDRVIRWTLCHDLAQDGHVWVPLDAVISPAEDGVFKGVETNGLASGNTVTAGAIVDAADGRPLCGAHHPCVSWIVGRSSRSRTLDATLGRSSGPNAIRGTIAISAWIPTSLAPC
jgi:hypothetical protein